MGQRNISFSRRITDLAEQDPSRPAITCGDVSMTRSEIDLATNRLARDLAEGGVTVGDMVTVALPNSVDWFVAVGACWKVGAIPQQVSSRLPEPELRAILELADPKVVIGVDPAIVSARRVLPAGYRPPSDLADDPLPDVVSPAWKAPTSGGSTGRPKVIIGGQPALHDLDAPPRIGRLDGCAVVPGPLYHNGPIGTAVWSWMAGSHVVVLPRFDPEATLAAVATYRADLILLVPTMMKRIWRLPEEVRAAYDVSSLQDVWHLAEPCPAWLKQNWIDWLGPEKILEAYGGTEGQTMTSITGTEWLVHRGSVGRPHPGTVMIAEPGGAPVPAGQQGEIWLRNLADQPTYRYVGATAPTLEGGWESLGDMGWLDDDGYLYLGDRKQDMILVGGANIYPAEIEGALQEHPAVRSCAVIGLPHDDLGSTIHAIVEADSAAVTADELLAFVGERLVRYKVPRSLEFTDSPLRDDAGKVRRVALRAERVHS